jgi:hypothetical protein
MERRKKRKSCNNVEDSISLYCRCPCMFFSSLTVPVQDFGFLRGEEDEICLVLGIFLST